MKTGLSYLPYQDAALPIEQRITDLIQRMTLPEKVGQMLQLDARQDVAGLIRDFHVGSILHTSPADMILAAQLVQQTRCRFRCSPPTTASTAILLARRHHLSDAVGDGLHLGPGPDPAGGSRDGARSGCHRAALDLFTRACASRVTCAGAAWAKPSAKTRSSSATWVWP
jgi:hypothetical protein